MGGRKRGTSFWDGFYLDRDGGPTGGEGGSEVVSFLGSKGWK